MFLEFFWENSTPVLNCMKLVELSNKALGESQHAQSPAGKPSTKAGLGLQDSSSLSRPVSGSGLAADSQSIVDSNNRPAGKLASTAFISWHPSGAPGVASPNGCQPTKAGRITEAEKIDAQGISVT